MELRSITIWICLIAFVGSAGLVANGIFPNNTSVAVGALILAGSFALYVAMISEFATGTIVSAIRGKDLEQQTSLLSAVIGRTLYKVITDEKAKEQVAAVPAPTTPAKKE